MADDGVGHVVVKQLLECELPEKVHVLDGGTQGIGLIPEIEKYNRLIIVDAVNLGIDPGEWRRFSLRSSQLNSVDSQHFSLHEANLASMLKLAEALDALPPEVIIYGIQPENLDWDSPMSESVRSSIEPVTRAIQEEIAATCSIE